LGSADRKKKPPIPVTFSTGRFLPAAFDVPGATDACAARLPTGTHIRKAIRATKAFIRCSV